MSFEIHTTSLMSDRVTVERKEFESFLAENQKLIDRSRELMSTIDKLEKENRQLKEELEALRASRQVAESSARQVEDSLKRARNDISRLIEEADKRVSK